MIYYYINNITKIPVIHGKDSITGLEYFQFGMSGKRYYFNPFSEKSRNEAYEKVTRQSRAIQASKQRKRKNYLF